MITRLVRPVFSGCLRNARAWEGRVEQVQTAELLRMVKLARATEWGAARGFDKIRSYSDFCRAIPGPVSYEEIRPAVMRMIAGEKSVLWPGKVKWYAQSSGTSDGRSKYIPITEESFRRSHYRGAMHSVAHYLDNVEGSRLFDGKAFILGGSFANELALPEGVNVGDLSASLIRRMPRTAELVRVPSRRVALMADWRRKLPALVKAASARRDITNLSGVPSWFMTVLKGVLELTGAASISEVWPRLEVFFHGGIAFGPYRSEYASIIGSDRMHYLENYNASEGFFAVQNDLADPAMLMLLDAGQFFEFIPVDEALSLNPTILAPWEVEKGKTYALLITGVNGLWRYPIGDTVTVRSVDPLKITIAGRTKHFINAFGEEVMVHNTDAALTEACAEAHCSVANYTAAPVYAAGGKRGRHEWLIEFSHEPHDLEAFAGLLDEAVQRQNSDYAAKRTGGLFLDRLTIVKARPGLFDDWLASTGKLGGQRKVPRLSNDRKFIDPMLTFNVQ